MLIELDFGFSAEDLQKYPKLLSESGCLPRVGIRASGPGAAAAVAAVPQIGDLVRLDQIADLVWLDQIAELSFVVQGRQIRFMGNDLVRIIYMCKVVSEEAASPAAPNLRIVGKDASL